MPNIAELNKIAAQCRRDALRMVHSATSGHPGGSLGCADFFVALYFHHMELSTDFKMEGKGEDLFFLSNGHIAPIWYSVLARRGFFEVSELATLRKLNSRLQGHPATEEGLPGIRVASGSLGQGLSVACGMALAKKMDKDDHLVFVLSGDGELQEGQNWEALMFAAHNKLDNIIMTVDYNNAQIDGPVDEILSLGDLELKMQAFGWDVLKMDGNNMEEVVDVIGQAKTRTGKGKPVMILMTTVMGQGVDFMMTGHHWHGKAPNDEQLANALEQLDDSLGDY